MNLIKSYVFFLASIVVVSCNKEEIGPQNVSQQDFQLIQNSSKMLIGCEGTWGLSNASLSLLDIENGTIDNNVYAQINGNNVGDILQSMYLHGSTIYATVNNSSKILLMDTTTLEHIDEVSLVNRSPRYLVASGQKGFVSNFVFNPPPGAEVFIDVLDLNSNTVIDNIDAGCWVEEMIVVGDKLFACGTGENKILVIDIVSHLIEEIIEVGKEPISIKIDGENLWVLCSGGVASNHTESASIWKIDPEDNSITSSLIFTDQSAEPSRLIYHENHLFWLANGLFKMNIDDAVIPNEPFINTSSYTAYSIAINPFNDEIYISDAKDYQSAGSLVVYDSQGNELNEYEAGVIPSSFLFY